jgi:hypothetical protein
MNASNLIINVNQRYHILVTAVCLVIAVIFGLQLGISIVLTRFTFANAMLVFFQFCIFLSVVIFYLWCKVGLINLVLSNQFLIIGKKIWVLELKKSYEKNDLNALRICSNPTLNKKGNIQNTIKYSFEIKAEYNDSDIVLLKRLSKEEAEQIIVFLQNN